MKTLRWNGERWYVDSRSLWKRVRQWVIWIGGWERANGAGWQFSIKHPYRRVGRIWMGPTPVSLLGHRVTFFSHWFDFRIRSGVVVVNFRERHAYVSRDGTPNRAHHWLWGVPVGNQEIDPDAVAKYRAPVAPLREPTREGTCEPGLRGGG